MQKVCRGQFLFQIQKKAYFNMNAFTIINIYLIIDTLKQRNA